MGRKKTINIRDLFIEPNFNELEAVSTDSKGGPKKLSQAQLESLRRTGEFQVDKRSTGCPVKLFPLGYLLFCQLLLMQIAKLGMILKTSGKLLYDGQMGTIILKIDLEIAEIIEVKVATFNIEIIFLPLCNSKMSISK